MEPAMETRATSITRRGKYRRYYIDSSIEVPRSTAWRYRRRSKAKPLEFQSTMEHVSQGTDQPDIEEDADIHDSVDSIDQCYGNASDQEDDQIIDYDNGRDDCSNNQTDDDYDDRIEDDDNENAQDDDNGTDLDEDDDHETGQHDANENIQDDDNEIDQDEDDDHETGQDDDNENDEFEDDNHTLMDDFTYDGCFRQPLYNGTDLTVCAAICSIMQFALCNNLTNEAIEKLLKLLKLLLPSPNRLPRSFYKLKAFFEAFSVPYRHFAVCGTCEGYTEHCNCEVAKQTECHLLQISLAKPLSAIIDKNWDLLQYTSSNTDHVIRDVWDGLSMKRANFDNGNKRTISLIISTDGIPLFKSSTKSLWPVSFAILNLPPAIRMYSENIVLAGFWVGSKPSHTIMKLLLTSVLENLSYLSSGLTIRRSSGTFKIFFKLIMGSFDLPAKASVLNAKQYNGKYGCSICMNPGFCLPNNSRIYLPCPYRERTHATVMKNAATAEENEKADKGIFGTSPLASVLDLVDAIPVDYMHCVLLGVAKMLLTRWFDSSYHRHPYYLGKQVTSIDLKLLKQRPPSEFSRPPRSIQNHLKYWKASELRSWLLFYSLPLLLDHLPSLYWHHYCLLVCSMHILLGDAITPSLIDAAEQMLSDFYSLIPELYGDSACTHNVHLLSHLTKYVRLWGPLWTHSTFGFESKNGYFFHGRNTVHKQLVFNSDALITLQFLRTHIESDSNISAFLDSVSYKKIRLNMIPISEHCYRVGASTLVELTREHSSVLDCEANTSCECFFRLFKDGEIYHCTSYKESKSLRNDTVCCFRRNNSLHYGEIIFFVMKQAPVALVNVLHPKEESLIVRAGNPCREILMPYRDINFLENYFIPIEPDNSYLISVDVRNIIGKCVVVETDAIKCVIVEPNKYEHH